jgi:integrase
MWKRRVGERLLVEFTDDDVFHQLEAIAAEPARVFNGYDADGRRIYRNKKTPKTPGTLNGYANALAAVFTWCIKKRRVPKSFENPCRKVERLPLHNAVVRFLSDDERERLLEACRASCWSKLYVLVLMALTTGARRGELLGLRWRDLDCERAIAYLASTKNGEARVLPLVPSVLEQLQQLVPVDRSSFKIGAADRLIFHSDRRPDVAYNFVEAWRDALKVARVRNFRFHDLRHTCASYLAQKGATLLEIADVLGHRQMQMVKRYAHLSTQSKAALVKRMLGEIR